MVQRTRARYLLLLTLMLAVLSWGCSKGPPREPVYPVSGTLTYKGKPMRDARVSFLPLNNPTPEVVAGGIAGDDGVYHLKTYAANDGSPAGEFIVTIIWPQPGPPLDEAGSLPDQLRGMYASRSSPLRATVQRQTNTIDFNLK